jgi:enterochelin esterase-like enzyme
MLPLVKSIVGASSRSTKTFEAESRIAVKRILRFTLWLLLAAAVVPLGSCAELALPPEQLSPNVEDVRASLEAPPDTSVAVVVNIAPTPTPAPTRESIADPQPAATAEQTIAQPLPTDGCRLAGQLVRSKWPSEVFGHLQPYAIYLPPCYGDENNQTRYPVIYLFHGWPMDENHWINLGVVSAAERLIGSGELPPFIIVMPRGDTDGIYNHTSGGDNSWEGAMVNELIPYIDRTYRTLRQRDYRAVGGISRGGVWSLEIAFRHPDLFASVGAHSAALSVNLAATDFDPLVLANTAPIDLLRIYIDSGDSDWTRDSSAKLSKLLEARHIPYTFTLGQGDHTDPYWASQVEAYLKFYAAPWKIEKVVQQQLSATAP